MAQTTVETAVVSLAAIRLPEILFFQRQEIFTLAAIAHDKLPLLQHALETHTPVKAVLDTGSGQILDVWAPTTEEVAEFERGWILLEERGLTRTLDPARFDPTAFDVVDAQMEALFRVDCAEPLFDEGTARAIFDFCARQGCYLDVTFDISPCIPFQYVVDGCYARAHKMQQILTGKYGYCCLKLFSFGNQGHDRLAVRASQWGGCCVSWWYHVGLLVAVTPASGRSRDTAAMVIDPSLFDKPVLVSAWVAAQANTACSANANVSTLSIQPGEAYQPADYAGTRFTMDVDYMKTNATLTIEQKMRTCP